MTTSFILLWCIVVLAWLLLKSRMAHRKTLDAVLAIVVAWGVLFDVPFFVPQIAPFALQIGIITTVILAIFSVIYFYPTGEETSLTQVEVAPEIVVNIDQRLVCEPKNLTHLLRKEVPSLQVYLYQCLRVKARTVTVKSLMAKTWIDGRGPYYLNWAPKPSEQTSENLKRVDLFPEEEAQLPIWYAAKQVFGPEKGFPVQLTIASDDVFQSAELDRLENPIIGIAIQFIAENYNDPKPRQFKLNAKSWDELNLTDRR